MSHKTYFERERLSLLLRLVLTLQLMLIPLKMLIPKRVQLEISRALSVGVSCWHISVRSKSLTRDAASQREWHLHEILLSGWGLPIGELFDLEKLSEHCKEVDRWSFFVSSEVCNVPGGVARYISFIRISGRR